MKKICFHVIKYYPSLGGTELLAKQVIDSISDRSEYDITVLTTPENARNKTDFKYKIDENMMLQDTNKYDLSVFFSDLWSPQLNNYNINNAKRNICVLNLDEITYNSKNRFNNATQNLKKFDLVLTFSKNGIANKFLTDENIKNQYIANFSRDTLATAPVFNLKTKLNLDNKKIGLYCAAFDRRKNQLYFLNMIKESKELKNYNWIFIGNESDKQYQTDCIKFRKQNNINNVFFISSTTDPVKINTLLQQVDFVCLFSTAEGTPLTLLEAAAANKPFIFTPVGGSKGVFAEVLENGAYCLDNIAYNEKNVVDNIKKSLVYSSQSLRNIWLKNHHKDDILQKYKNIIHDMLEQQ